MPFTNAFDWDGFDFVAMALLLGGAGTAVELSASRSRSIDWRAGAGFAVVAAVLLIWINLAAGIIGTEANAMNLLFLVLPAVAFAGSFAVKFSPSAMARVMALSAFALALVPPVAWIFVPRLPPADIAEALALTCFFAALWLLSAWFFKRAAREQAR